MKEFKIFQVTYDIKDDTIRLKLAGILNYYGLHRIQYSVFQGLIKNSDIIPFIREIEDLPISCMDSIQILVLCTRCSNNAIIFGKDNFNSEHLIL